MFLLCVVIAILPVLLMTNATKHTPEAVKEIHRIGFVHHVKKAVDDLIREAPSRIEPIFIRDKDILLGVATNIISGNVDFSNFIINGFSRLTYNEKAVELKYLQMKIRKLDITGDYKTSGIWSTKQDKENGVFQMKAENVQMLYIISTTYPDGVPITVELKDLEITIENVETKFLSDPEGGKRNAFIGTMLNKQGTRLLKDVNIHLSEFLKSFVEDAIGRNVEAACTTGLIGFLHHGSNPETLHHDSIHQSFQANSDLLTFHRTPNRSPQIRRNWSEAEK